GTENPARLGRGKSKRDYQGDQRSRLQGAERVARPTNSGDREKEGRIAKRHSVCPRQRFQSRDQLQKFQGLVCDIVVSFLTGSELQLETEERAESTCAYLDWLTALVFLQDQSE